MRSLETEHYTQENLKKSVIRDTKRISWWKEVANTITDRSQKADEKMIEQWKRLSTLY